MVMWQQTTINATEYIAMILHRYTHTHTRARARAHTRTHNTNNTHTQHTHTQHTTHTHKTHNTQTQHNARINLREPPRAPGRKQFAKKMEERHNFL